jgi:hypothetical protein
MLKLRRLEFEWAFTVLGLTYLVYSTRKEALLLSNLVLFLLLYIYSLVKTLPVSKYINGLNLIALVLLLFKFDISNNYRWLIILFISFTLIIKNHKQIQYSSKNLITPVFIMLILRLVTDLFYWKRDLLLQFLGFGYDNAFHFMAFRGLRETSWMPFGSDPGWWTEFELFRRAPSGASAIYSFMSVPLIGSTSNPYQELAVYGALSLCSFMAIIFFAIKLLSSQNILPWKTHKILQNLLLVFLITGSTGVLLSNGFPPYVIETLLIIYWVHLNYRTSSIDLFNISSLIFCLLVISPGPFAFMLLPAFYLTWLDLRNRIRAGESYKFILHLAPVIFFASSSYIFFIDDSGTYGWRHILAAGGVKLPSSWTLLVLTILFVVISMKQIKSKRPDILFLVVLSGGLSVGLLSILTIYYTGSVQYYALKQLYVWIPLCSLLILATVLTPKISLNNVRNLMSIFLIATSAVTLVAKDFNRGGGFMNTFPNAIANTINANNQESSIVNAKLHLKISDSKYRLNGKCLIYKLNGFESDLNSRWANALNYPAKMDEECFSGYWNSSSLSNYELLDRLRILDYEYVIIMREIEKDDVNKLEIPKNVTVIYL